MFYLYRRVYQSDFVVKCSSRFLGKKGCQSYLFSPLSMEAYMLSLLRRGVLEHPEHPLYLPLLILSSSKKIPAHFKFSDEVEVCNPIGSKANWVGLCWRVLTFMNMWSFQVWYTMCARKFRFSLKSIQSIQLCVARYPIIIKNNRGDPPIVKSIQEKISTPN